MNELVVGILLLLTAFLFSLELRRRRLAETRLYDALASVEQQVADRTAALSRAMAELEQARHLAEESSRLKDEFLSTASHELRTPLNAIVGWAHVLQTGALADDDLRGRAVQAIERNARVQTRLIEDLLDVSRMIQGRVSLTVAPLNIRAVVDAAVETIRPAAAAKNIAVDVEDEGDVLPVVGDEHRLQQVTWNLLANAVKYTPHGGTVKVMIERDGECAIVRVQDDGKGIESSLLPYVFDPFRQDMTTVRSGLGLGLAIVRLLVDLHGGQITAASNGPGQGSVFTMSLPLAHGAAAAAPLPPTPEPLFNHLRVLIAEDDLDSAAALTAILKLHGCETQIAASASECLRMTGEWRADVLICDVGLPDDDGYGLLRRLRQTPEGERLPAIALTAYSRPEDRAKALAAGFRAHLSKPIDPESLLRELARTARQASENSAA
jgi:signal transduction histidine kinase/ActR/RegA family two-component response regulator